MKLNRRDLRLIIEGVLAEGPVLDKIKSRIADLKKKKSKGETETKPDEPKIEKQLTDLEKLQKMAADDSKGAIGSTAFKGDMRRAQAEAKQDAQRKLEKKIGKDVKDVVVKKTVISGGVVYVFVKERQ
jgi:hypothetical protein